MRKSWKPWWQSCGPIRLSEEESKRRLASRSWNTDPFLADPAGSDLQAVKPLPGGFRYHCRLFKEGNRILPFCELEPDPLARPLSHLLGEGRRPGGCRALLRDLSQPPEGGGETGRSGGVALALLLLAAGIALLVSA